MFYGREKTVFGGRKPVQLPFAPLFTRQNTWGENRAEGEGKGAFCLKSRATNTTICSMERILSLSESNLLGK